MTDWAKNFEELVRRDENRPTGDNWFTSEEFIKNSECGITRAYRAINKGIDEGKIEIYKGNVWSETHRQLVRAVWYRFIKPD